MAYYRLMHGGQNMGSKIPGGKQRFRITLTALSVAFVAISLAGCSSQKPKKFVTTPAERAYLENIKVTPGRVEAATNFLGHTVTTLHGTVTNNGNKTVVYLEVRLTFMSIEGKPLEEKRVYPVSGNTMALKSGQTHDFQISFDKVPADWNQAWPNFTLVRVLLAGD